MLDGLPSLFDYLIGAVTRGRNRGSVMIVVYRHLGDVVNAVELALNHYLPLIFVESLVGDASSDTPYAKWATVTNEDFQQLDGCLRRLIQAGWLWYDETFNEMSQMPDTIKDTCVWFETVCSQYAACVIDPIQPTLTLSKLNLNGWIDPANSRFLHVLDRLFEEKGEALPPIVTTTTIDISERSVIADLRRAGFDRLEELRALQAQFGEWLRANCTIAEITAPHGRPNFGQLYYPSRVSE